jgi:diguanylate cyclase (GGDEF)-like protein
MVNVADREYFEKLRNHSDLGMVIFEPHMAKTDQVWRWTFIRRINKPDGSFGGVVYVALDIDQIQSMLNRLQQNSHDVLVLRDKDFRLVTRQNDDGNAAPSGDSSTTPIYQQLISKGIVEGFYEVNGNQSIDGVRRLFSYRINPKYGFLIANGVNWKDAFATWYLLVAIGCTFLTAFIVAILLLARFISQSWRREENDILKRLEDEAEREKLEEQIRHMAYYDALTDLPNRRLLSDRLGQALVNIKRSRLHGALMFIDLDNFKPLNDLYGHAVGDLLLIEVGRRLKACIREMDTVARIGGDEFIVLIGQLEGDEEKSLAHARLIVEKIHISLSQPYQFEMHNDGQPASTVEYDCGSSIGVAVFSRQAKDIDVILSAADSAMYEAKTAGRNQVKIKSSVI